MSGKALRPLPLGLALGVPLFVFLVLERRPAWNVTWSIPHEHFYIISLVFLCAGVFAGALAWAGRRLRNLQVTLLALAFVSLAGFLAVHGLMTPGVLFGPNVVVGIAVYQGTFFGALFLWLASLPADNPAPRLLARCQRAMAVGWATLVVVAALFSLSAPHVLEGTHLHAPPISVGTATLGALLAGSAMRGFWRAYRYARQPLQGALTFVAGWLMATHVIVAFSEMWTLSWWLYHLLLVAASGAALWGLARQFAVGPSVGAVLQGLFLTDPLDRLQHGLSGGVADLVAAMEARDPYTAGHTLRVARLAVRIGEQLGLPPEDLRALAQGGMLHDVGKIRIPHQMLNKPGPLTDEERAIIQRHPEDGYQMAVGLGTLAAELDVIRHHHERWDGQGYPKGLAGEAIPLLARVLSVADVYDALTSKRAYREPWSEARVRTYLREEAATQFDPRCVAAFEALDGKAESEGSVAGKMMPLTC